MDLKSVSGIVCLVNDLDKSTEFYETLGFVFKKKNPGISAHAYLNWFWIELLLKDKVVTEEFKSDVAVETKGAGQYIHVSVADVDGYYEKLVAKGLQPSAKPKDFAWGHREFVLSDPDGYKLVFFQKNK